MVALATPPTPALDTALADYSAGAPDYCIAKDSEIDQVLVLLAGQQPAGPKSAPKRRRLLGDVLIQLGYLTPAALRESISEYDPDQDGFIGQFLVERQLISLAQLNEALVRQRQRQRPLTTLSEIAA
jgi:adsorption protein B